MKMKLGYFYYDLLNLYGENGNVKILAHHLREQGIDVTVDCLTLEDKKDIASYDWIYMGCGVERSLVLALKDAVKYREDFRKAIDGGTFILATGNSFEMFGKEIRMPSKTYPALNLLSFSTEYKTRTVHDLFLPFGEKKLVGFENHSGATVDTSEAFFIQNDDRTEGIKHKNFIGTYTIGPLLVRNPHFLKSYLTELILHKDPDFSLRPMDLSLEEAAYETSIKTSTEMSST